MPTANALALQTLLVGGLLNFACSVIAFYLWNERRGERFLLFWALGWTFGWIRWATAFFALGKPELAPVLSLQSALLAFFFVLGAYDLLPGKPWKQPWIVGATALADLSFTLAGLVGGMPAELEYARFFTQLLILASALSWAYASERLPGYAFAAGTIFAWGAYVGVALAVLGKGVGSHVVIPLFNVPLMFTIIIIAYQRSRRELQENERTLQKIFDTAPTPIVITRPPHGEIERANALAIEALGLPPADALGRSTIEHGLVADAGAREGIYAELAAGRKVTGQVVTLQKAGGDARILAVHADRILLASGERYIFSFYDLTELRRAESDLAHAQRVTALGELAASLAHEVGQPLTAILANAQAARRFRQIDARHPELDETLEDIATAARDAGETISRLRILFRKGATQHALVSLNAVVEDVLRLLKGSLVRNRVEVVADLAADLPAVTGDAIQLRQVLLNLLVNAQEAITAADAPRRQIHVSTRRAGAQRIAVTVRDSGPGIAESELERIFEHFVTTKPNGLGMGLAVSRTIVEAHDGRIWAERAEGAGLSLRIELPAAG